MAENVNNSSSHIPTTHNAAAPSAGEHNNQPGCNRRKKKPRRFKSRFKGRNNPYPRPDNAQHRKDGGPKPKLDGEAPGRRRRRRLHSMRRSIPKFRYPFADAPNNTNEFLMADHDEKVVDLSPANTDGENDRLSPVYDYLEKDFDNTYQRVCAEKLEELPKSQLLNLIFTLENKVDDLNKQIAEMAQSTVPGVTLNVPEGQDASKTPDPSKMTQAELVEENRRLILENRALREFIHNNAVTTSSSSSSSSSSRSGSGSESEHSDEEQEAVTCPAQETVQVDGT